jgi:hypothetical protein
MRRSRPTGAERAATAVSVTLQATAAATVTRRSGARPRQGVIAPLGLHERGVPVRAMAS